MKKTFKYIFIAVAVILAASCMRKGREIVYDVVAGNDLYLPLDGEAYNLAEVSSVEFYWAPSVAADNGYISYELLFDKVGGDFSKPIAAFASQYNGSSPSLVLSAKAMNKVAKAVGLSYGESGDVIWTVQAGKGINGTVYSEKRRLTVSPLNSMDPLPQTVSLGGDGAETGGVKMAIPAATDGVAASEGIFECFTSIKGGTPFTIEDNLGRYYKLESGGSLVNTASAEDSTLPADGIYRLQIDFDGMTWQTATVAGVIYYAAAWTGIMETAKEPMTYAGHGTWELRNFDNAISDNDAKDSRHRFNMTLGDGTILYLGTSLPLGTEYTTSYWAVNFFTADGVGNKDWDKTWNFLESDCGRPLDCYLYLNADNPAGRYYHEYIFK